MLLTFFSFNISSQTTLKFNTTNIDSVDKWVAFPADENNLYLFGFIYLDSSAGLRFRYQGRFKIDTNGTFVKVQSDQEKVSVFISRMEPNETLISQIPETKHNDLEIKKFPDWLKIYKTGGETKSYKHKIGYLYNRYNEPKKTLEFLI